MYKYLVLILTILSSNSQAEDSDVRQNISYENLGLVEVSDSELTLISGQTGTPEQMQIEMDNKSPASLAGSDERSLNQGANYQEPPMRSVIYNGREL